MKPDHKVVVHLLEEAYAAAEAHNPCCEDQMSWYFTGGRVTRLIAGNSFHFMVFPTKDKLERFATKYITDDTKSLLADPNQHTLQGVYFPSEMGIDDSPTLHLFECPGDSVQRYDMGDFHFPCGGNFIAMPEIKYGTQASRWLICERERLWNTYRFGYVDRAPGNRFSTHLPGWCNGTLEEPPRVLWEGVIIAADDISQATDTQTIQFQSFPAGVEKTFDPFDSYPTPEGTVRNGPKLPTDGNNMGYYRFTNAEEATRR